MSKVIKRNGAFELSQDENQCDLIAAREKHKADIELLENANLEPGQLSEIVLRLLQRVRAIENPIC